MSFKDLDGFAFVTGAASGIGCETALSFAEAGAAGVVFADLNEEGAQQAAEESKKYAINPAYRALHFRLDVSDEQSVKDVVDATVKHFGRIDYALNAAGVGPSSFEHIINLSLSDFDRVHNINARGTLLVTQAVSRVMMKQDERSVSHRTGPRSIGRGSIVCIGSGYSISSVSGHVSYATSKHAVMGIVKTAALDLAPYNIRVNAVLPWWTDTPMVPVREIKLLDEVSRMNPMARISQPYEPAGTILFLCSPLATFTTAQGLLLDAGKFEEQSLYEGRKRINFAEAHVE